MGKSLLTCIHMTLPTLEVKRIGVSLSKGGFFCCLALILVGSLPLFAQQEIQCKKVLGADNVASLLEAGVPEARIKNFVTTCKVGFELSKEQEKKFRDLGASSDLVLAMVLNYQKPAPPPKPEEARVCIKPLSESDFTELLEAGVVDQRLQQLVNTCGVSFQTGPEQAKRFQALGASSDLVLAILRNYKRPNDNYVLERTLTGHSLVVWPVAFGSDGKLLASGSWDKTIKLWDVSTGRELRTLSHTGGVSSVAFSPDGRLLASGVWDKTIKLWDVSTGRELRTLKGHTGRVFSVAFSPDGKLLASGSEDDTIKLWDVQSGRELRTLKGHIGGGVSSVAFSPDGKLLASGSEDTTIKLWDVATGRELRTLTSHIGIVWSVAFSPDGKLLASGSDDKTIKLWRRVEE